MSRIKRFSDFSVNEAQKSELIGKLPAEVKTVKDAEALLLELSKAGKIYHFDDDPHEIIDGRSGKDLFTKEEADLIEKLMDQAFDVCEKKFGKHGFWEKLINHVFIGYITFGIDDLYVVSGEGGKNNVRITTKEDFDTIQASAYNVDNEEWDEVAVEKWFKSLKAVK